MKKKFKFLALFISLTMLVGIFTGCGKTGTKESKENTSSETNTGEINSSEADIPEPGNPTLPLVSEPVTFTTWVRTTADISKTMSNLGESEYFKELEKRTGIHAEFIHPPMSQEKESLNILIASGDYPDILVLDSGAWPYPGGLDKGISDGTILRLNELIDQYAPNYKALINSAPDLRKGALTDEGNIAGFFGVTPGETQPAWYGPVVRQDWLDELGLETPETYDDWYTMLKAFKEKKGAEAPMMLDFTGFPRYDVFTGGYGVGAKFYQVDGKVKFGPLEEGYKEYLTMMSKWYAEGLIDPDYATKKDFLPSATYISTGKAGAWFDIYILLSVDKMRSEDPNYRAVAVPSPAKNAGDPLHLRQTNVRVGNTHWVITDNCKDPETAVKWIDYNFSPEGSLLANYGVEGETFTFDVEGNPQYTEFMYKNPDGLSLGEAMAKYVMPPMGGVEYHWQRELVGQPKDNLEAPKIWGKNNDGAYYIPPTTLTVEEGEEYAAIMGDIDTYISEMNTKFIMGQDPISQYDDFVNQIKAMNIERAIELQQAALDRYNARQ